MKKIFLLLILTFTFSIFSYADQEYSKNVLVLHSYSPNYKWTENIQNGIKSVLDSSIHDVNYYFEFMDTKTQNEPEYYSQLFKLYYQKYKDIDFDGVIVSDNNALNFIIEHQLTLAKDSPIVAIGINNVEEEMLNTKNISILVEKPSYKETIDLAIKQNPSASIINIVIDKTNTSSAIKEELIEVIDKNYNNEYSIHWIDSWNLEKISKYSSELNESDILLFVLYFQDSEGNVYIDNQSLKTISKESKVPIYVLWDFQMDTGALGGHVISGFNHGKKGSELLLESWVGVKLPLVYSKMDELNQYIIDYNISKKFKIEDTSFSSETQFINKEPTYYEENSFLIWVLLITTFFSVIIILLLLSTLKKKTQLIEKDKQLNKLRHEVIESRRKEISSMTASEQNELKKIQTKHHRNVGEICFLLGKLSGLELSDSQIIRDSVPFYDTNPLDLLGRLNDFTDAELEHLEFHITFKSEANNSTNPDIVKVASLISLQSKEKWDGTGFPLGLKGEQAHIASRIFRVADMFDSLITETPSKSAWTLSSIVKYFRSEEGKSYDPALVEMLLNNLDTILDFKS